MRDSIIHRTIKRIILVKYMTDLAATRAFKRAGGEPLYYLKGTCNACGRCCETPVIKVFPLFFRLYTTRWLILTWHRLINGFEYIGEDRIHFAFIFRCTHFDPATGTCDSYESRPGLCRDYPRNLVYSPYPEFLSGCGYYAVYKKAEQFRNAIDKTDLSTGKKEDLFKKLHIKE